MSWRIYTKLLLFALIYAVHANVNSLQDYDSEDEKRAYLLSRPVYNIAKHMDKGVEDPKTKAYNQIYKSLIEDITDRFDDKEDKKSNILKKEIKKRRRQRNKIKRRKIKNEKKKNQSKQRQKQDKKKQKRQKRFTMDFSHPETESYRWDDIVEYDFDLSLPAGNIAAVHETMLLYEYKTFLRFQPKTDNTDTAYLHFIKDGESCWSFIGRVGSTFQEISCCDLAACIHEIGHALGFFHEQSHQLRELYELINVREIKEDKLHNFDGVPSEDAHYSGYVDLDSPMQYGSYAMSKNGKKTLTTFNKDNEFMVYEENDSSLFYFFKELSDVYRTKDKCPAFTMPCDNHGYVGHVNGVCQCVCPLGLETSTGCSSIELTYTNTGDWPLGDYVLLQTDEHCPQEFGWSRFLIKPNVQYLSTSSEFNANVRLVGEMVEMNFCTRTYNTPQQFPKGSYCLAKGENACPSEFMEGQLVITTLQYSWQGFKPDITYSDPNITIKFCCRHDAHFLNPATFPTSKPFMLYPKTKHCQTVKGMRWSWQYFVFSNRPGYPHGPSGDAPYVYSDSYGQTYMYYCYYEQETLGTGGGIFELTSAEPSVTISTPNYGTSDYDNNMRYTWFVKSEANSTIRTVFEGFDVAANDDGSVDDYLEIITYLPGSPGLKFYGNEIRRSFLSDFNYTVLHLYTNKAITAKGFKATLTMIKQSDLCYSGYGENYDGTRNITIGNKPCLYWKDVQHCTHNTFEDIDVDAALQENYCRNPGSGKRPWCYVDAAECEPEICDVCNQETCYDELYECDEDKIQKDQFCNKHGLECKQTCGIQNDCYPPGERFKYNGTVSFTANNKTCQNWMERWPTSFGFLPENFPSGSRADSINYCRDPGNDGFLWCMTGTTTEETGEYDHCTHIPECVDGVAPANSPLNEPDSRSDCVAMMGAWPKLCDTKDKYRCAKSCGLCDEMQQNTELKSELFSLRGCRITESPGVEYSYVSHTRNGIPCRQWDNDDFPKSADNYCRTFDELYDLWCYTTDPNVLWEYCDVPQQECQTVCSSPMVPNATPNSTKSTYYLGDTIIFTCDETTVTFKQTCSSTGNWIPKRSCKNGCPSGYTKLGDSCFKVSSELMTKQEAVTYCAQDDGYMLSEKTNRSVVLTVLYAQHFGLLYRPWLDLSDMETEAVFKWADGSSLDFQNFQNWAPTEPSSSRGCRINERPHFEYSHVSRTVSGIPCRPWNKQPGSSYPISFDNFCRNFDKGYDLWSYTDDPNKPWEYCDVPLRACKTEPYDTNGCRVYDWSSRELVMSYETHTLSNLQCRHWGGTGYSTESNDNFCRSFGYDLWCYTTNTWEYCDVPHRACIEENPAFVIDLDYSPSTYTGTLSINAVGKACRDWTEQTTYTDTDFADDTVVAAKNYCRDPSGEGKLWCYDKTGSKTDCDNPSVCSTDLDECRTFTHTWSGLVQLYRGTVHVARNGKTCIPWTLFESSSDSDFPYDGSVVNAHNYCRGDTTTSPWCYTSTYREWSYCDVPNCCQEEIGYTRVDDYVGKRWFTHDAEPCLRWDAITNHTYTDADFPDGSISNADNYCRAVADMEYLFCYISQTETKWCDVPLEEDVEDCVVIDPTTGMWEDTYCDDYNEVICEATPIGSSDCLDEDGNKCVALFTEYPDVCRSAIFWASSRCAKTCGVCSDAGSGVANTDTCSEPLPMTSNVHKITTTATVTVGQYFEYECVPGTKMENGNQKRGCLPDGSLTGQDLVCSSNVDRWTTKRSIKSRRYASWTNCLFFSNSSSSRVESNGLVKGWKFFVTSGGVVGLYVLRKVTDTKYKVIGEARVSNVGCNREVEITLDASQQIPVLAGDFIGGMLISDDDGGIAYDRCAVDSQTGEIPYNPEDGPHWFYHQFYSVTEPRLRYPDGVEFNRLGYSCRIYSLAAKVGA